MKKNVVLIFVVVSTLSLVLTLYYSLLSDPCFEYKIMMNPYGTGNQKITVMTRLYSDRTTMGITFKTEDGELVGYEWFDRSGNMVSGFNYEGGTFYRWVLNRPDDPSKDGKWQEEEPPSENPREFRVGVYCFVRELVSIIGLGLPLLLLYIFMKEFSESSEGNDLKP